nr:hypothetical protein [Tanacetum cinerariifolium]
VGKGFSGVETPLFEGMLVVGQPAEKELVDEQVQIDNAIAAAVYENVEENVVENVVENVSQAAILSPLPHDIPSPSQALSSPPQQQHKIVQLKARVKKLEKANKIKSSKLRRLRKVRASRRVESSDGMEDVFNQERMIADMDMNKGIELVKDAEVAESEGRHAKNQAEIYNLDLDHSSKVLSMQEDDSEVQEVVEFVTTAKLITEVVTAAASQVIAASTTILAASATIPAAKPTISAAAPTVPMKKKDQIEMDAEYARKLQEEIDRDHDGFSKDIDWDAAMDHNTAGYKIDFFKGMTYAQICPIFQARFDENIRFLFKLREEMEAEDQEIIKSINETPSQKATKRRKLSEEAQEAEDLRKRLEVVEDKDDDVFVEATPLASKTMFEEPDGQDAIWRNQKSVHGLPLVKRWKLLASCGVYVITLSTVQLFLLVERRFTRQQLQEYQQG